MTIIQNNTSNITTSRLHSLHLHRRTGARERYEPPGWNAWFGADRQGRDLFSLMLFGARPSLALGLIVTIIASIVGTSGPSELYRRTALPMKSMFSLYVPGATRAAVGRV